MIRLNPRNPRCRHYEPPFPVKRHFGDPEPGFLVECLLWIPAVLVSRFTGQFPHLENEADELFSRGVQKVVETVAEERWGVSEIGSVCQVRCRRAMEDYANGLTSVVKVCTTTRYENRKRGVKTPRCQRLVASGHQTDDETQILLRDAAEVLGVDLDNLSAADKRNLWSLLQ